MSFSAYRTLLSGLGTKRRRRATKPMLGLERLENRRLLAAPQDPVVINDVTFGDRTTTISWDAVDDTVRYQYWFSFNSFRPLPIPNQAGIGVTSDTTLTKRGFSGFGGSFLSKFNHPGLRYRVWVRAQNDDGFGPWGPGFDFTLPGRPVEKVTPDVATSVYYVDADSFSVSWPSLVDVRHEADTHEVWVSRNGQRIATADQVDATFTSGTLEPGVYKFWIRGKSQFLKGAWSDGLTIAVGASRPQLTGPVQNEAPLRPEFTWSAGLPGVPYQLWVQSQDSGVVINQSDITETSFTPNTDLADGLYSAWVRQVSDRGEVLPWSSRYRFAVGQSRLPEQPVLQLTPNLTDDAVEQFLAIFRWDAAANADHYELSIANQFDGKFVARWDNLTGTSFTTPTLTDGVRRAWLRTIGANGETSPWSDFVQFRVHNAGSATPGDVRLWEFGS